MKEKEKLHLKKNEAFDFAELTKGRDELFQKILDSVPRHEISEYAELIFQNSIDDGIKFAEKVHLKPTEIIIALSSRRFGLKHEKFVRALSEEIKLKEKTARHVPGYIPN